MSSELKVGAQVTLHIYRDERGHRYNTAICRYGNIIHISATTILLELRDNMNIDYDDDGRILHGNYNYRFEDIIRIDPY